jgi:hypothetical protein
MLWEGLGFTFNDLTQIPIVNSVEPHSKMVTLTFSVTLCLQSLTAPPQRVSQVNASA